MKWPSHLFPSMKVVLVCVFSCKHPLMFLSFQSVSEWWRLVRWFYSQLFKSADEILRCDNSIETFSAISLSWYTVFFCFSFFSFGNCVEIWLWSQLGLKWLRPSGQQDIVMLYCIRAERPKTTPCVATCSLFSSTLSWYFYYSHWHLLHVGVLADSESEDESSQDEKRRKKEKKSSKKKKRKSRHKKKRWR